MHSSWYNVNLKRLFNKKKRLIRATKGRPTSESCWSSYFLAANEHKKAVSEAKLTFLAKTLPTILIESPKAFCNTVNWKEGYAVSLLDVNGEIVPRDVCADILNDTFAKAFSTVASRPN